jgi:hypothetical protein
MTVPSSAGGLVGFVIGALVVVAVGIAILSRVPVLWGMVNKQSGVSE